MDNQNMTVENGATTPQQEEQRTFTQDQLNAIVQDRLTRERSKHEEAQADLGKREQELVRREFALHATELLKQNNLPIEIMDALNGTDKDTFAQAVGIISKHLVVRQKNAPPVGGAVGYIPHTTGPDEHIRKAMGLKK